MSHHIGGPPQPWRWGLHQTQERWHVILPTSNGTYHRALCGFIPKRGWDKMRGTPPEHDRLCRTCWTHGWRQGAPIS